MNRELSAEDFFNRAFKVLTDYCPLKWQRRLYLKLVSGEIPDVVDLPTGVGKTSIITIWLIAFAWQMLTGKSPCLPRRIIYIVNRRTVVDQATRVVEKISRRIFGMEKTSHEDKEILEKLKEALQLCTAIEVNQPLAISTLRGELADNEEWKADPTRPAIIIGTIDMIGSKLLFSGYGDSYRVRPHHAGLIGQDALIIHDEAHLTPAFSELLHAVAREQEKCNEPRPIKVIELSATLRKSGEKVFKLEDEDEKDGFVKERLDAKKSLYIHEVETGELIKKIVERAKDYQSCRSKILIYAHSPEQAKGIVNELKKSLGRDSSVALLTGTIRGYERDKLVESNPVFLAFMSPECQVEETFYLVCTSAGEVGVDLYAHHIICDATTLESLIQRLGRGNRDGKHEAEVHLFIEKNTKGEERELQKICQATVELLRERLTNKGDGAFDVSPRALKNLLNNLKEHEKEEVFTPKPKIVPVNDILLDAWAMTSIREKLPGRPSVADYLHGIEANPPETYLAWRREVSLLVNSEVSEDDISEWFQHCRIESRERLRDLSSRVFEELKKIAEVNDFPVILIDERGGAKKSSLHELTRGNEDAIRFYKDAIRFCTVVLPVEAGGLTEEGILDGRAKPRDGLDILSQDRDKVRLEIRGINETYEYRKLEDSENFTELDGKYTSANEVLGKISGNLKKSVAIVLPLQLPGEDEEEVVTRYLALLAEPKQATTEDPESVGYKSAPKLKDHLRSAAKIARKIVEKLGLEASIKEAIVKAAEYHDLGKDRECWQSSVFNNNPNDPWAKSGPQGMDWRRLAGYRHEFGSLLDAKKKLNGHEESDLILHLIAAHHGRARPHFELDAWDNERYATSDNEEEAYEVMRRYERLQRRFGRWGLAWLESLVRCADVIASRQVVLEESTLLEEVGDDQNQG